MILRESDEKKSEPAEFVGIERREFSGADKFVAESLRRVIAAVGVSEFGRLQRVAAGLMRGTRHLSGEQHEPEQGAKDYENDTLQGNAV